jgi:hypothetical protein
MGYRYSYDITKAAREINAAAYDANDAGATGFVQWGAKQDLYKLKWILDDAIKRCPTFAPEEDWLREQEKQKVIRILKDE